MTKFKLFITLLSVLFLFGCASTQQLVDIRIDEPVIEIDRECDIASTKYYFGACADRPSFYAPLTTNLNLIYGQGSATFTRSTTGYVQDFEGLYKQCLINEARFEGARRVENICDTANMSNAGEWSVIDMTVTGGQTDPDGGSTAYTLTATASPGIITDTTFSVGAGQELIPSIWLKRKTGSGAITMYKVGVGYITLPVDTTWKRYAIGEGTETDATTIFQLRVTISGDEVYAWHPQLEVVTGQTNKNPSEYLDPTTNYGAGVNGVKYFDYENGNTVASNVITEAQGAAISASTLKGVLIEGARTESINYSRDFSNWTDNNCSAGAGNCEVQNVIGFDGVANSAWTLSDDNAGASTNWLRNETIANDSNTHTASIFIKKDTDETRFPSVWLIYLGGGTLLYEGTHINTKTGAILNEGAYTDGTSTIEAVSIAGVDWWRLQLVMTNNSTGNTTAQIQVHPARGTVLGTSNNAATGSAVFDQAQFEENASFPSSPIPTTTGDVTRNVDYLTYPTANNVIGTTGSTTFDASVGLVNVASNSPHYINFSLAGNRPIYVNTNNDDLGIYDGAARLSTLAVVVGTVHKIGATWGGSSTYLYRDGTSSGALGFDGDMDVGTTMTIGSYTAGASCIFGTIKEVKIWKTKLSDARMQTLTTP